jgi:hypothetical protein
MGRPINKNKIGQGENRIEVTRYRFEGESQVLSSTTPAWIVSQRSTNKFIVTDGTTTETLTLVNKTSCAEGEFAIDAVLDDSTVVQVTKLYNRKIQYEGGTANVDTIKYSVGNAGTEDDGTSGTATVDGQ